MRGAKHSILAAAALVLLPLTVSAAPACPALTASQAFARADVVFVGVAQRGPVATNGLLTTPVRFKVVRFLKGSGPSVIQVAGGPRTEGIGFIDLAGAGVRTRAGQKWVVYAKGSSAGIVETSSCYGTHLSSRPNPFVSEATPSPPVPSPTPVATTPPAVPTAAVGPSSAWVAWAAAGVAGLGLVMGIGWGVARRVIGTA
jgi:hypothetical protein